MANLLAAILFWTMTVGVLSVRSSMNSDVIYDELVKLNVTCDGLDTCREDRGTNDLRYVNCHCDSTCKQLGTCCVDSEYRTSPVECGTGAIDCSVPRGGSTDPVFMVVGCKRDWDGDDFVKHLCTGDGETLNDPLLLVPVSSSRTGITYRNYFCFVCNDEVGNDSPVFWDLKLISLSENVTGQSLPDLIFNETVGAWTVRGKDNPIDIRVELPSAALPQVKWCRYDIVKTCAENWTDAAVKAKCQAYTAVVLVKGVWGSVERYQNPHCAICNFKDASDVVCREWVVGSFGYGAAAAGSHLFVGLFSFEEKIKTCPRNQVYDKFAKKCRTFKCGKTQRMVEGTCVAK